MTRLAAARRATMIALAALIALAAFLALSGCGPTKVVTAPSAEPLNTVTADGTGKVTAVPDLAVMTFGATAQSENAKTALNQASKTATSITSALKKSGIAEEDIQTQNVSVYPQYETKGDRPDITGYQANVSVTAKIRDIGKLGDIIGAASDAGADNIGGPTFTLDDESPVRDDAIAKAVENARSRAEAMAKAAGKSVGDVLSMSSSAVNVPVPLYGAEVARDAAKAGVPIEPGTLDITADVTVVFELK